MRADVSHVVFDLGGVIVKLRGGTPIPMEWLPDNLTPAEAWHRWLTSDGPRLFESGKIGKVEFSERVVSDFKFRATPEEFLHHYNRFPEAVYEGAKALLKRAATQYTTACFSNTNELHWNELMGTMGLDSHFEHKFASHLMGLVKPDAQSYEYVIAELGVDASKIVFFDDNLINVDAARNAGMQAQHVVGVEELTAAFNQLSAA